MQLPALGVNAVMLPELDFDQQVELCSRLGIRYYQYRPREVGDEARGRPSAFWGYHRFDLTPARFLAEGASFTRRLRAHGLEPWGSVPDFTADAPDDVIKLHCDAAAAADAPTVRITPIRYPQGVFDLTAYLRRAIDRYRHIVDRIARPAGRKIILETHVGTSCACCGLARQLVDPFDPADVGVIFDLANFACEGRLEPTLAVSILADRTDSVHLGAFRREDLARDAVGGRQTRNVSCHPRDGELNLPTWLTLLATACPDAPWIIEDYDPTIGPDARLLRYATFVRSIP